MTFDFLGTAEVERHVKASAQQVFDVLADGWLYASWVVGTSRIRAVDDTWPAVGSQLHHSFGNWPLLIDDSSRVIESKPPRRLVLVARGWPLGEATVAIDIEPDSTDTCTVTIREDASSGPGKLVPKPFRQGAAAVRNQETLRRLAYLAEGGAR